MCQLFGDHARFIFSSCAPLLGHKPKLKAAVHPEKLHPRQANGSVGKFNDLPPQYRANPDATTPFAKPHRGKPFFTEAEISDVVAFLKTLTDRYRPQK